MGNRSINLLKILPGINQLKLGVMLPGNVYQNRTLIVSVENII
jgi:hypothetical protein